MKRSSFLGRNQRLKQNIKVMKNWSDETDAGYVFCILIFDS
jgi:hypothetical protein